MVKSRATHPECPVSVDGDNKVDYINEKHDGIHITHGTVVRMDNVVEKLSYGKVNVKSTGKTKRQRVRPSLLL